ncbi:hypothetical protein [Paucibacter sp. M5-1]|uniref:hypothetical protein n=1 Tax=Paucibacter sp. M5-1 TaxID=3015998 RepID=UPI0022B88C0F|nr:hypothetical protein [Paucibacter sp. M5-1]MCZ7884630.1 hypothetical protein [Paucibacter sp. M5-1]
MPDSFKPTPEQEALITAAQAAAARANREGHHAPKELVRRMTLEGQVTMAAPEDTAAQSDCSCGAAVAEKVSVSTRFLQLLARTFGHAKKNPDR